MDTIKLTTPFHKTRNGMGARPPAPQVSILYCQQLITLYNVKDPVSLQGPNEYGLSCLRTMSFIRPVNGFVFAFIVPLSYSKVNRIILIICKIFNDLIVNQVQFFIGEFDTAKYIVVCFGVINADFTYFSHEAAKDVMAAEASIQPVRTAVISFFFIGISSLSS